MGKSERPYSGVLQKLRQAGLRSTRQRMALGRLLFEGGGRHVTAEQLHEEAARRGVEVTLATVYNTLHQFARAGLVQEILVESGCSYFDSNVFSHGHFFYEETGEVEDIPADQMPLGPLPVPPEGTEVAGVDVVVRLVPKGPTAADGCSE